ncbi:hypothetical protein [Adhaeribacter soli]|uniref:Uncharacterized protein n=1 Tax=Adhaeribacter soli TaxID=2607655 RepID=A0A5N1IJD4_9BACT|nr:hypothetical protein [Adhaeribacter soli]KAA9325389.1 hypothetical protein F0P94_17520 [Adhaeribacter soli]
MGTAANTLVEIFRTEFGAVYQCNRYDVYWVEFAGGFSSFKFSDFFYLKQRVEAIDVVEMAQNPARVADVVVLNPLCSDRCFVLTLTDVLHFRELLQGAKVMIELNSIINESLHGMMV